MSLVKRSLVSPAIDALPKSDPHYPEAVERAREAAKRLQELGIVDETGRRIRTTLPQDMVEHAERDFGG